MSWITVNTTATVTKQGGCIDKRPKDSWGRDYQYLCPGMHGDFDIFSYRGDGQPGGSSVNADIGFWEQWQPACMPVRSAGQAAKSNHFNFPAFKLVIIPFLEQAHSAQPSGDAHISSYPL
jgi:hypothetical protein